MSNHHFTDSTDAENAFYTAFSRGDLEAMREVWLESEQTSCIHPMGDRLLGTHAILKSWQTILKSTGDVIVELSDPVIRNTETVAIHTLVENIHAPEQSDQVFRFIVTNIYQQTADGWKMVLHHASPMPRNLSQEKDSQPIVH